MTLDLNLLSVLMYMKLDIVDVYLTTSKELVLKRTCHKCTLPNARYRYIIIIIHTYIILYISTYYIIILIMVYIYIECFSRDQ